MFACFFLVGSNLDRNFKLRSLFYGSLRRRPALLRTSNDSRMVMNVPHLHLT